MDTDASPTRDPRIRLLTRADLPACANVAAQAFMDDHLSDYMCPYRYKYPKDFEADFLFRFRAAIVNLGTWGLVCIAPSATDPEVEQVVAHAWWVRNVPKSTSPVPATPESAKRNTSLLPMVERRLIKIERWYRKLIGVNRAAEPKRLKTLQASYATFNAWEPVDKVGSWTLVHLAVLPSHQRRGIGGMMVRWGVERAEKEGVPAMCVASPVGKLAYSKAGAKVIDYHHPQDLPQDPCMVWDKDEVWTRRLKPGEERIRNGLPCEVTWRDATETSTETEPAQELNVGGILVQED